MSADFRIERIAILVVVLLCAGAELAHATGLYKGHGRRTHDYAWSWRVNGSVGFHGVEDPWDQFGVNSYPLGGYTDFGLEFAVLPQQTLEFAGSYRWVHDSEYLVALGGPGYIPRPGVYDYDVDSWSAGLTWRFFYPRGLSSGYFGMGGGWVFDSDLEYFEQIDGSLPYAVKASGTGPEFHAVVGYEGATGPNLRMGFELGFRYAWVDFDNGIYGAGNFSGVYLGFRLGLVAGR